MFTDLIEDYSAGLTPNPDILCNSRLKFTHFHEYAKNKIGCDAVATGHYARFVFHNISDIIIEESLVSV